MLPSRTPFHEPRHERYDGEGKCPTPIPPMLLQPTKVIENILLREPKQPYIDFKFVDLHTAHRTAQPCRQHEQLAINREVELIVRAPPLLILQRVSEFLPYRAVGAQESGEGEVDAEGIADDAFDCDFVCGGTMAKDALDALICFVAVEVVDGWGGVEVEG